jgi:short-subunit dehydrogenase
MSLVSGNVLVTGATGGIGHAIARAFAGRGASLTLTGRRAEVLEPLAAEVGGRALACDLSDRAQLQGLIDEIGEVDVLVANAGVPATGLLQELSQQQLDEIIDVNLRAPIALARALTPGLIGRGRGHLVFISSLSGKAVQPVSSMYSATKFGVRGFALALRDDLRKHRIGVSLVSPSFIRDAGMFADAQISLPFGVGTRAPEDVASAVIRAIERNRAEIDVAPLSLVLGTRIATVAPELAARFSRMMGNERIATELAEGQRRASAARASASASAGAAGREPDS